MPSCSHQRILLLSHGEVLRNSGYRRRVLNEMAVLPRDGICGSSFSYTFLAFLSLRFFFAEEKENLRRFARQNGFRPFLRLSLPSAGLFPLLLLDILLCLVQLAYVVRRQRIALIHAQNLHAGFICTLLKHIGLLGRPLVLDYHGAVPEEYRERYPRETIGYGLRKLMERVTIESADRIICVSNTFKAYLASAFGKPRESISVIPSCIKGETFGANEETRERRRQEVGVGEDLVLVYSGNIGVWHADDRLLDIYGRIAATYSCNPVFMLFLIPDRRACAVLRRKLRDSGFPGSSYKILHLEHETVGEYLAASDIAFLIREDTPVNRVASPTKFAEYLASGLPVFASPHVGDIGWYVARDSIGVVCENFEHRSIDAAFGRLLTLIRDSDLRDRCRETARRHFHWGNYTQTIGDIYGSLSENR